ncbi:hypothetical protein DFH09DRAFT_1154848, partial [Mycena vulgaris]
MQPSLPTSFPPCPPPRPRLSPPRSPIPFLSFSSPRCFAPACAHRTPASHPHILHFPFAFTPPRAIFSSHFIPTSRHAVGLSFPFLCRTSTPSPASTSALAFHLSFQFPARRAPLTSSSSLLCPHSPLSLPPLRSSSSPLSSPAPFPPGSSITDAPSQPFAASYTPPSPSPSPAHPPASANAATAKAAEGRWAGAAARARRGAHRYARAACYFLQSALSVTYS